ncbi:hypothetical protein M2157_000150 [Streptomyces sp. SAI-127]|nr:hypothetical protein [Streptomyces sp. SAI-127]
MFSGTEIAGETDRPRTWALLGELAGGVRPSGRTPDMPL